MAFLAHLLTAALLLAAGGSAEQSDADLLLEFKATFENGGVELDTWRAGTDPCQGWEGIKCDARNTSVTEIDLNGFSRTYLVGSLPPSGWQLPASLQKLILWKNSVRGTLPAIWQLPPTLVELDLASNLLTGSIPPELGLPPTLQRLSLDNNSLSGGLPRGLALPPGSILTVYNNLLSGTLPSWGPNVSITAKPGNEGLCGEVPRDADYIVAGSGNLDPGELPSCTAVLTDQLLALRGSFTNGREVLPGWGNGSEPCSWSGITCTNGSVTEINLRGLGLRGYLPTSGWALPGTLGWLDLSTNMIGGTLPASWPWIASNQGLLLDLHNNYIGGTLPTWANRTNAITIQPGNRALCGQVPATPRYLIYTVGELQQLPNCSAVATQLLLGFKAIFSNSNDTVLVDWGTSADPCQWPGIGCNDAGNVTGIVLSGKGLQGSIPGSASCANCAGCYGCWQDLPATTEVLDLSSNSAFNGSIPAHWVLPASLRRLNLSANALTGSIAQGWPVPPSLQELDLSSNGLVGSIHGNWSIPPTLRALFLQNNSLTGSVPPPNWVPVENAEGLVVRLDSNSMAGVLPTWPAGPYNVTMWPRNEELCGEVPATPTYLDRAGASLQRLPSCAQLSADRLLSLKSNSFNNSGAVLPSWAGGNPCGGWAGVTCNTLDEVIALDLEGQGLQGTFPPYFFQLLPPTLDTLDLSSNPLWGTISPGWKLPPTLRTLSLSSTNLMGAIPAGLSLPSTLQELRLDANAITGLLPTALPLPPELEEVWLHGNKLRGSIWEGWNLTLPQGLRVLSLHNNTLTGTLPSWTGRAGLNISISPGNPWLCGEVPPSPRYVDGEGAAANGTAVASLPGCTQVSADMLLAFKSSLANSSSVLEDWAGADPCQWTGVSCDSNGSVASLVLDGRGLQGSISPASWVFPPTISVLDLSHNLFTQSIPPDFALPPRLKRLELDSNLLTGLIPSEWNNSLPAGQLDLEIWLQNNSLSGPLPAWTNSSSVQMVIQAGNDGVCGTVPQSPQYVAYNATDMSPFPVDTLPGCQEPGPAAAPVSESGSSISAGAVAGIVVAAVVAVLAAVLGYWYWVRQKRVSKAEAQEVGIDKTLEEGAELKGDHNAGLDDSAADKGDSPQDKPSELLQRDDLLRSIVSKIPAVGGVREVKPVQGAGKRTKKGLEVDMKLWTVGFSDLKLVKEVGSGAFGRVYLGSWRETPVAVKLLVGPAVDLTNLNAAAEQVLSESNPVLASLQKEASMMAALRHPNVLGFMGICTRPPCVVSEYCARGSLFDVLRAARSSQRLTQELDWPRRLMMAMDGAKGMNYLHRFKPALIHRDLKSPNLLVDREWRVKVADFNLSRIVEEGGAAGVTSSANAGPTNPRWLAPEVLAGGPHTFASDVFSWGVVLWELLTWETPWAGHDCVWQIAKSVLGGERLPINPPEQLPGGSFSGLAAYLDLMGRCWAQEPQDRPSFDAIISELRKLLVAATRGDGSAARGGASKKHGEGPGQAPTIEGAAV